MSRADLYDELVMDHIKNARNYRALDDADRRATGTNPLCGDEIAVYLKMRGDRISDAAFQCTCCGISMASASIMTEMVKGKHAHEAKALLRDVIAMLTCGADATSSAVGPERRAMLETVSRFPARTRCAVLPWQTLGEALDQNEAIVVLEP